MNNSMKNQNEKERILNLKCFIRWGLVLGYLCLFGLPGFLSAQQTPLYTHAYLNPYLYNPALAGDKETSAAYFLYRKQWAGIDGAPETQVFTLDGELESHPVGLGVTFFNDITNVVGRTGGAITGAYEVNLTSLQRLRFGLSFLAIRNRIFFDRIRAEDISDPNLLNSVDQRTAFEGSAGLSYSVKNLKIGFSGEQLFQNSFLYKNEALFKTLDYTLVRHYYTTAEYDFTIGNNFGLKPHLLLRIVEGLNPQLDVNVLLDYKEIAWTNLNYRHGIGGGMSVGFALDERYIFSYSYEFPTTDLSIIGSNTHEFMLGIRLNRSGAGASSLKRAEGVTPDRESAVQYEKMDALEQQNEQVRGQLERAEKQLQTQNAELQRLRETVSSYQEDLTSTIKRLRVSLEDSASVEDGDLYLIVGAVHAFEDAKLFQRLLKREGGLDTRVIQSASGTWYFIYSHQLKSIKEALKLIKEISEGPAMPYIIGDPWIYQPEKK